MRNEIVFIMGGLFMIAMRRSKRPFVSVAIVVVSAGLYQFLRA